MKSYVFVFICFLLLIPMVSARDRLSFYIDANSWIEDDGISNFSRFTIKLYPKDDGRNIDIEDEKEFIFENKSHINNDTVIIRFDSSTTCTDDDIIKNITTICQTKTIELEDARKNVEQNKQACDKDLSICTTEKTDLKTKADQYDSMKASYDNCYTSLSNCTSVRDECQKSQNNLLLYLAGVLVLGGIIGFYGHDSIKKGFFGGKKSPEMRESPRNLPKDF